ncbi:uracil/xanthine transporter [Aneurinibacillus sp. Ricciae_BoGa-3]|uniref:uracil/xanthine transporter n=1 Tax=Aneurinibacillus sp. Ricciae_BoGa-3 TaxID=3022697 RepID=UPI00233FB07C|nr:uracil/xanthine transporter [Aneurinibacillus sp. Ricciae_BoGa-3]WCK54462.1 uracil/xanthine transporter [Aneurinibacillus sp. Ricciae_BoGa-3]
MSRLSGVTIWLAGVQWLFFMFANTVVIPISVGAAFHLPAAEVTSALQCSFIYTGLACVLQALFGHRLSFMEGQSGLWWGVILSLAASASSTQMSLTLLGGGLATGIILSGVLIAILGALGMGKWLKRIFSPVVMSVFLILLASQLIIIFVKGMLGLSAGDKIDMGTAGLSILLIILVSWLNVKGRGKVSNFSILIGIMVGWILYSVLFHAHTSIQPHTTSLISLFPWGQPNFEWGIVLTALLTGLINTTNTVATLRGGEQLFGEPATDRQYQRSFILTGINSIISGLLGMVPYAPYTSSLGFLQSTRILERSAFIAGGLLFMVLGLIPFLGSLFATMPVSVGDAVLFVAYLQLFGAALKNIEGIRFNSKTIYRIAGPALLGIAMLSLPAKAFGSFPMLIRPLLSNGLLVGILLSVVLENIVNWSHYEEAPASRKAI